MTEIYLRNALAAHKVVSVGVMVIEGQRWLLASCSTQGCLMESGNSLHPPSSPSGFRASLEMSWPWLEP